jgi:hypothetical protein
MEIFRWLWQIGKPPRPKQQLPEAVIRVFENQKAMLRGQQLTDEALSHQALGNSTRALTLLEQALSECRYAPAMTVKAKLLVDNERTPDADKWLRSCLDRLANDVDPHLEMFCRNGLRIEMHELLGKIQFRYYGEFSEALRFFQTGLDAIDCHAQVMSTWAGSAPEEMRSSIYGELAHLHAIEGDPELATRYSKARLQANPDCEASHRILRLMDGFEPRPFNFKDVIDLLVGKLIELKHAQALQIHNPFIASELKFSIVPVAFAWLCMCHKVKRSDFLSGPEVSLLTERAVLALAGSYRRATDEMSKQLQRMAANHDRLMKVGVRHGKDSKTLSHDCEEVLSSVMRSIPVEDLSASSDRAVRCLADWCTARLKLTDDQSMSLLMALPKAS